MLSFYLVLFFCATFLETILLISFILNKIDKLTFVLGLLSNLAVIVVSIMNMRKIIRDNKLF